MAKREALALVLLLVFGSAFAQEGYKEHRWGDDVLQVEALAGELTQQSQMLHGYPPLRTVFQVLEEMELDHGGPDPLTGLYYDIDIYGLSEWDKGIAFWFLDDALVAVGLAEFENTVLPLLRERYGEIAVVRETFGSSDLPMVLREACVWSDGDRVILWHRQNEDVVSETVTYIDRHWYENRAAMLKERTQADADRID